MLSWTGYIEIMEKSANNENILLGRRIRTLRNIKGWTQEELGNLANINYKFLGEIERGQQNPSFNTLLKISDALEIDLSELFRLEQQITNRAEIIRRIKERMEHISTEDLSHILSILNVLYPVR
jgi:transcriptional regulator with XRE-family HTH domain